MAKLEDVLKANGYSDADIEAMAPMLADSRFRSSMENHFNGLEAKLNETVEFHENWRTNTANPHIAKQEQIAAAARLESAQLRERLAIVKDLGLLPADEPVVTPATPAVSGTFNPKDHKLVTEDDLQRGYAQFADAEGRAIAMAADLNEEYRSLSGGKSLYEYVGQNGKRGMTALREEAIAAKQQLDAYVATKFDFNGKRNAAAEAAQKAHDDAIVARTQAEMATKYGNPMLRQPMVSRQPFIPAKNESGKFPWEQLPQDRRNARLERAMKTQYTGQPN